MQPVLIVARPVKCLSSLPKASQLDVQIVSIRTNLKEALAETEEDLAVIEDSIIGIVDLERCTRQLAQIVGKNAKFLLSQLAKSRFIVGIVLISN
tara:strand:+ start:19156 stop:19440 length:285 start_codon:yes stop_codon:yes gene_type:complete